MLLKKDFSDGYENLDKIIKTFTKKYNTAVTRKNDIILYCLMI